MRVSASSYGNLFCNLGWALLSVVLNSCAATPPDPTEATRHALLAEARPADSFGDDRFSYSVGPELVRYLDQWRQRLGLSAAEYRQTVLSLESDEKLLGLNVLLPSQKPEGTLFQLHGYLANSLTFAMLDAQFLKRSWSVTAIDLPGHGMSQGPRADVDVWSRYGDAVRDWLAWAGRHPREFPRPWVIVAHSLGGASVVDYLSRRPDLLPDRTILVAPLIRPVWYDLEVLTYSFTGWAIRSLPPAVQAEDYLGIRSFPTHWFKVLSEWNDRLARLAPWSVPQGIVLQGTKDGVVDGNYNAAFLRRVFPGFETRFLEGFDHVMLTQSSERLQAWNAVFDYLADQGVLPAK